MQFYNDALDDPLVSDGSLAFTGGADLSIRKNRLQPEQYSDGQSMVCDTSGSLVTRRGTIRLEDTELATTPNGIYYYKTPSHSYAVQGRAGSLYYFDGTDWQAFAGTYTGATTANLSFAQGINKLFWADGVHVVWSWDGATATALSGTSPSPTGARQIVWHTNRLVAAGSPTVPDGLWFSDFLDGATWQTANMLQVGAGDGDPIIAIVPWLDSQLVVFKQTSVWVVDCNPLTGSTSGAVDEFTVQRLADGTGCVAPRTARRVGNDVFFLSQTGLRTVQRSVATESQFNLGDSLSTPIKSILDRITPGYISACSGYFWNNRYLLTSTLDGSTTLNNCSSYNLLNSSWEAPYMTNMSAYDFVADIDHAPERLLLQTTDGVFEWRDYVSDDSETSTDFQDADVDIPVRLVTKGYEFAEQQSPKTGMNVEFEFDKSLADATAYALVDNNSPVLLGDPPGPFRTSGGTLTLPFQTPATIDVGGFIRQSLDLQFLPAFREIAIQLEAEGKLRVRSIVLNAWTNTAVLQNQ